MTDDEQIWLTSDDPLRLLNWLIGPDDGPQGLLFVRPDGGCHEFRASGRKLRLFCCACMALARGPLARGPTWHLLADFYRAAESESVPTNSVGVLSDSARDQARAWCVGHPEPPTARVKVDLLRDIFGNPFRPTVSEKRYLTDPVAHAAVREFAHQQVRPIRGAGLSEQERETWEAARDACVVRDVWLNPTVLTLARAAYEERVNYPCVRCKGRKHVRVSDEEQLRRDRRHGKYTMLPPQKVVVCPACDGTGTTESSHLDPARLVVLADALEEAGCTDGRLLRHLRVGDTRQLCCCGSPLDGSHDHNTCGPPIEEVCPHVRGCWALDTILGRG